LCHLAQAQGNDLTHATLALECVDYGTAGLIMA